MAAPTGLSHLSAQSLGDIFKNLLNNPALKVAVGVVMACVQWTFGPKDTMLLVIAALVAIDTFTGVWKAAREGKLSSRGISRVMAKLIVYFIFMATGALVDKSLPIAFALTMMWSFIAITEALSIIENIAQLGFPVPTLLVKMLLDLKNKDTAGQTELIAQATAEKKPEENKS